MEWTYGTLNTIIWADQREEQPVEAVALSVGVVLIYTASLNLKVKVLDFVQHGGPDLTVGGTVFDLVAAF